MLGGRPVRSRLTRRMRVTRSASGEGLRRPFARRARMKASMEFAKVDLRFTRSGTRGREGATNDQWSGFTSRGESTGAAAATDAAIRLKARVLSDKVTNGLRVSTLARRIPFLPF